MNHPDCIFIFFFKTAHFVSQIKRKLLFRFEARPRQKKVQNSIWSGTGEWRQWPLFFSVANLETFSLDLATFQTLLATFFWKATRDKFSDLFRSWGKARNRCYCNSHAAQSQRSPRLLCTSAGVSPVPSRTAAQASGRCVGARWGRQEWTPQPLALWIWYRIAAVYSVLIC